MKSDRVWYYWVFQEDAPPASDGQVFFREHNEFLKYLRALREVKDEGELCGAQQLSMEDINRVTWHEPKSN